MVVDLAALSAGDDVVDVACGTGNAVLLAAARGARVVGVGDAAPQLLEVAREPYVAAGQEEQPMALAARPVLQQAGVEAEVLEVMTSVLQEANEDPTGLLIHSPYVVHELRASTPAWSSPS